MNTNINNFYKSKLNKIIKLDQKRELIDSFRSTESIIIRNKKKLVSFCCNDYLGLTQDNRVINASIKATKKYGTGAGASRLISGNHELFKKLEKKIAIFKGEESACIFGSGFLANIGIIPAISSKNDLILYDELSHASTNLGLKLSHARVFKFRHNNILHLKTILKKYRKNFRNCFLFTEGVFSMDGDRSKLKEISILSKQYNFSIVLDDAHGFGILGNGKGSQYEIKPFPKTLIQMGTLSKAIGSYGGFIAGSKIITNLIYNKARSLIYTTGLPPSTIAASIKSLEIISKDSKLREKPLKKAMLFCKLTNLPKPESCIVSIVLKKEELAIKASNFLEKNGFYVGAIRPPTIPKNTSRLRFTFTAMQKDKDIVKLANLVNKIIKNYQLEKNQ